MKLLLLSLIHIFHLLAAKEELLMPTKKVPLGLYVMAALTALTALMMPGTPATAQTEKILHTFGGQNANGFQSWAGVVFDAAGNLYGTTSANHGPVDVSGGEMCIRDSLTLTGRLTTTKCSIPISPS